MTRTPTRPIEHTCDGGDLRNCACVKARRAEARRVSRNADPDQIRRWNLMRFYGMTIEDYDAMRAVQDYRCAVCGTHEDDIKPPRTGRPRKDGSPTATPWRLVVDHCHTSGSVRGLLCANCNQAIGQWRDNPGWLRSAAGYLDGQKVT